MENKEHVALELTKALIIGKPEILDMDDPTSAFHDYGKKASNLLSAVTEQIEARFDPSYFEG